MKSPTCLGPFTALSISSGLAMGIYLCCMRWWLGFLVVSRLLWSSRLCIDMVDFVGWCVDLVGCEICGLGCEMWDFFSFCVGANTWKCFSKHFQECNHTPREMFMLKILHVEKHFITKQTEAKLQKWLLDLLSWKTIDNLTTISFLKSTSHSKPILNL